MDLFVSLFALVLLCSALVCKLKIFRAFDTKDWSYKGPAVKGGIGMPKFLSNINIGGQGGAPRHQQPRQAYQQQAYQQPQYQDYQAPQAPQSYNGYQSYPAQGYDQGYQQPQQNYQQPQQGYQAYSQQPQQGGYEQQQPVGRRSARNNPPYGQY